MTSRLPTGAPPRRDVLSAIVEHAGLAPSIHNTQPWWWREDDHVLELHLDDTRVLTVGDPTGRSAVISCGAALHHARVAAHAMGWRPTVERVPDHANDSLLARVRLDASEPSSTATEDLWALRERRTDRRRFTSWPVPRERLEDLARAARQAGGQATELSDASQRFRLDLLMSRAHSVQAHNAALKAEQRAWTDRGRLDGLVTQVLPAHPSTSSRFPAGAASDPDAEAEPADHFVVLSSSRDTVDDWLCTGEGLSALWMRATHGGLSVVPLTSVIEVTETRAALQHEVLDHVAVPQLLLRIGWQPISRSDLPHTPRRPVKDILRD